jgi:hypothetical protein
VPILVRVRRVRSADGSADARSAGSVFSSFNEVEEMLTLSPMLVGGVEDEDSPSGESSTVIALSIDSAGDARVAPSRDVGRDGDPILSRSVENIATVRGRVA